MTRLLHGRFLYILCGLVIMLSALSPKHHSTRHIAASSSPAPSAQASEWWPQGLTAETLQRTMTARPLLAMALSILTGFGVATMLGGVILTLRDVASGSLRSLWRAPTRRLPSWSFGDVWRIAVLVLTFASFLGAMRATAVWRAGGEQPDWHLWLTVSMLILDLFAVIVMLALAKGKAPSAAEAVGFSRRSLTGSIPMALRSYVVAFPWLFLILFAVVQTAHALGFQPPTEPIQELLFEESRPIILGLTALLACVVGPVAEELFFRGVLYPAIRRRTSRFVAMLGSGALFAASHMNLMGFLSILFLGCLLADLYERTGSLAGSLTIHILHNSFLMGLALAFRPFAV